MGLVRFTLALVVLASHAGAWSQSIGARASVQVFFVLSGLYMAAVFTTKYRHADNSARTFYLNRALRLWPTYLFLLALTAVVWLSVGNVIGNDELIFNLFTDIRPETPWMAVLAVVLFGQDIVSVNEPLHYLLPVRQSWSIASELLFYLTVPFILRAPQPVLYFIAFIVLMAIKYVAVRYTGEDRLSYFFPLGNYGYFLLGCSLYFVSTHSRVETLKKRISPFRAAILAALLLVLLFGNEASFEIGGPRIHMLLIVVFSLAALMLFERSTHPVGTLLGNLSYGIYLNHFLLIGIFKGIGLAGWSLLAATVAASCALSFLTERYVQKPIDRYRYRHIRNKQPSQTKANPPEGSKQSQGATP
jgi:peptidoglycan/LPS O-acetylase OafA/YrhL